MTPADVAAALRDDARLLMAVGGLEVTGSDLPLGSGTLIAQTVVEHVSERTGIVHAPALAYGVRGRSSGGDASTGSAGLRRKTLHRAVNELLADWEDHGVEEFVIVTMHRSEAHMDALLMALTSTARTSVFDLRSFDVAGLLRQPGRPFDGTLDASIMAFLRPEGGWAGSGADPTMGQAVLERWIGLLVDTLGTQPG